ncbi:MAG: hypothetical protein ACI8ZH_000301 [Flavobacteriales bacterium]|jgi:hypothetical protein
MNKIISLGLVIGLIAASCTDPNTIGLELHPEDKIIISSDTSADFTVITESEDSLRTDEALNLILGKIIDPDFNDNTSSFLTQILLTENNTDLGTDPTVDSVVLSYTYSGYYGKLEKFNNDLIIRRLDQPIYKDSTYYSNFSDFDNGEDLFLSFMLNTDELNPLLHVNLSVGFAQDLFNDLGNEAFVDNETFLTHFNGLSVSCDEAGVENTMLYLNPTGSNSFLKIYYHNEESDSLSLDFELGGDAARINLFNPKPLSNLNQDDDKVYIQSMAGYKTKITVGDLVVLAETLKGKAINKVTMSFICFPSEYPAHEKLFLVRVNEEGKNVFLTDYTIEGETHFGGRLESDKYEFNITRYFVQLLNNDSYTNELYLLPAGAAVNANRTILEKDIKLTIHYSEL